MVNPAGLEVSSGELMLCIGGRFSTFRNDGEGISKLVRYVRKRGPARVCLEATGNYHLDVALALHGQRGIELQVLNPWAARRFAEAQLRRAKTDQVDAAMLEQYAACMPHQEWQAPSAATLALRSIERRMQQLADRKSMASSQLHASLASAALPAVVAESVREELAHLDAQLAKLQRQALAVVADDEQLAHKLELLLTVPGLGERSAIYLLGELAPLASDMSPRQLVAHAGLDPRPIESGSSVHKPRHISKRGNQRLRHILYMPALVAANHDPYFNAFYLKLQQRQKAKKTALVAIMRKLLHAICGVWRSQTQFDGTRLFPSLAPTHEPISRDLPIEA